MRPRRAPGWRCSEISRSSGQLVHDLVTGELDETIALAQVRENANGLVLVGRGPTHLVKAVVWALAAAHAPSRLPAIR